MNSWRKGRDKLGWKLPARAYRAFLSLSKNQVVGDSEVEFFATDEKAPVFVEAVPLMREHLSVLMDMFVEPEPALKLVRGKESIQIIYSFGDVSGEGFDNTDWEKEEGVDYRFGIWGLEGADSTSNWRESKNLACHLESKGARGELIGKEIFIFTDNTTAESIAHKGSSSSPLLFDIVVRLSCLSMKYNCTVELIHVSGKRMIAQGTDGLSRGDMLGGVMRGDPMLKFVPLNRSAVDEQPNLMKWIEKWAKGHYHETVELLRPDDWVWKGHDIRGLTKNIDGYSIPTYSSGTFVWSPPPAAGNRGNSNVPNCWWTWKGKCVKCSKKVVAPGGIFCQNYAARQVGSMKCHFASCAKCYRADELWKFPMNRAIDDESKYFKRRKQDADKFLVARNGDWIIAPFQCEHCWFVKFCGKPPNMCRPSDRYKWSLIRRANLDIFWSREKATVSSQHNRLAEIIRRVSHWGWPLEFLPRFPPRFENDASDMMMAMLMLEKSREPGRNVSYTQYDTLRQF